MSYFRFKLAKTGSMVSDVWLFTEFKENWQYFFNEATMTPDAPGDVDKVLTVKAHTRRRGPGAPAKQVASHSRYYARIAKTKGSARPGRTYTIIEPGALGGVKEQRQFSLLGDDMDIQAYAKAKAKFLIRIKGENGWTSTIQGAGAGGTAQAVAVNP
ncbi:MAG: hypothetical protein QM522_10675 [Chitinophagaceae bacterium]|nr:hypothetical protein [Chitinophagaceae bacterium]